MLEIILFHGFHFFFRHTEMNFGTGLQFLTLPSILQKGLIFW